MLKIAGIWFLVEQVCVSGRPKPLAPTTGCSERFIPLV